MRRAVSLLPLLLLPLAMFLAVFQPAMLDVRNIGWLLRGTDNGENALGLHAYLHDPAAGASLRTTLLDAPDGVPLLFTDSNPLLALILKPVAPFLPADTQMVGAWLLLCLVLQVAFAWLLLRRVAPGPLALWAGVALLAALPTLFNRFVHANLFAHWLILAALCLFLDPQRGRRLRWWAPLLAATALVHNYLLVMVAAIWATAMLEPIVTGIARERWRAGLQVVVVLAMLAAIALWLGAGGRFAPAGNYGAFAMPLDALVNPANPSFSTILPATAQHPGRGFEGFQYLGAGLLLTILVAIVVAIRTPRKPLEGALLRRLLWLAPAFAVLTLLAITNYPEIAGRSLPRFALPAAAAPLLDAVRASGRLFWPVAYTIALLAVVTVYRLGRERAGLVLVVAVAVQILDLANMFVAIRAANATADARIPYDRMVDPRWPVYLAAARDVAFEPAEPTRDLALFQQVAWRAAALHRPVRTVYAARDPLASVRRKAADHFAFVRGDLRADRFYILSPSTVVPPPARTRLRTLDGVRVLVPISPSSPRSVS